MLNSDKDDVFEIGVQTTIVLYAPKLPYISDFQAVEAPLALLYSVQNFGGKYIAFRHALFFVQYFPFLNIVLRS